MPKKNEGNGFPIAGEARLTSQVGAGESRKNILKSNILSCSSSARLRKLISFAGTRYSRTGLAIALESK